MRMRSRIRRRRKRRHRRRRRRRRRTLQWYMPHRYQNQTEMNSFCSSM
jgi:hypothetical protein